MSSLSKLSQTLFLFVLISLTQSSYCMVNVSAIPNEQLPACWYANNNTRTAEMCYSNYLIQPESNDWYCRNVDQYKVLRFKTSPYVNCVGKHPNMASNDVHSVCLLVALLITLLNNMLIMLM